GIPIGEAVCIPVDVECTTNPNSPPPTPSSTTTTAPRPAAQSPRAPATSPAPSSLSTADTTTTRRSPTITVPPNPLDQLLGVLAAPTNAVAAPAARSTAERIGGGVRRVGRFVGRAAGAL